MPFPLPQEALILLPLETSTNDGNQTFTIPAGTVWLRARFLVGNSPGYAGLRVKGGSLRFDRPALPMPGRRLAVASNNQWRLTLEPEQPEAGDANGSDADALIVGLPTSLEVRSTGAPSVSGALSMTGFGSDLEFANPAGGPSTDLTSIVFPSMTPAPFGPSPVTVRPPPSYPARAGSLLPPDVARHQRASQYVWRSSPRRLAPGCACMSSLSAGCREQAAFLSALTPG